MSTFPRWNEMTGIYGGAFDPPHLGHRDAVRGLFSRPGLARVWVVPTGEPALKASSTLAEHRLAMARLAFSRNALRDSGPVEVLNLEVEHAQQKPHQKTYAFDTIRELKQSSPKLAFVIGTDQLRDLHLWHHFPELLGLCHWIVLERKGEPPGIARDVLQLWSASGIASSEPTQPSLWRVKSPLGQTFLQICPTNARECSSTQIRETLARAKSLPENTVDPGVEEYLKRHHLYGTATLS